MGHMSRTMQNARPVESTTMTQMNDAAIRVVRTLVSTQPSVGSQATLRAIPGGGDQSVDQGREYLSNVPHGNDNPNNAMTMRVRGMTQMRFIFQTIILCVGLDQSITLPLGNSLTLA